MMSLESRAAASKANVSLILILSLGLTLSAGIFILSRQLEDKAFRATFELQSQERISILESDLQAMFSLVRALKAFYDGSQRVERGEFRQFSEALLEGHSMIQAVEWIPRVPQAWRRVYEESAREQGYADFQFLDLLPSGGKAAAPERSEYYPVYFAEPEAKNRTVLGSDESQMPRRFATMEQSRDAAAIRMTPPLSLWRLKEKNQTALIAYASVYQKGKWEESAEAYAAHLAGFVTGVFKVNDLVSEATGFFDSVGIDFYIDDVTDSAHPELVYENTSGAHELHPPAPRGRFFYKYELGVGGRKWDIYCFPSRRYMTGMIRFSWAVLVIGCLLTLFLGIYLSHVIRHGSKLKLLNARLQEEIKERAKTAELRASEERFRGVVDQAVDALLLVERSGRFVDVNQKACDSLGYSRQEFAAMSVWDIEPGCERGRLELLWSRLKPGVPLTVETIYRRKDSRQFPVEISVGVISLRGQEFLLLLVRDITLRKEVEEELRRANAFLDSIVENIPHMIFLKDAKDLRFVRFNKAAEELLGYTRGDFIGKTDYDFFPKEEADFFTAKDRNVLETGHVLDIPEEPVHTRRKGLRIVHTKKIPIFDHASEPLYLLGISEDITDKKRAEDRLRELGTAMENAVEAISRVDKEGRFVSMNRAFADLVGQGSSEAMTGQKWQPFVHHKDYDKADAAYEHMVKWGKSEAEIRVQRKEGSIFYAQLVMVKVHDHDSKFSGSYFFIKDITERKYKESLDVKSELISMVAHELRTPLHAVREGISIMLDGLTGELNADQQEVLSTTKTSLDRLVRLVNAFLDFQRLEAGIMDFRLQPADLNGLVLDARKQAELLIKNKPLKIECRPQENLPAVLVDRDRIIQVLMNLLNNAIKFTEQGVITVTTETTDGGVKVSVRDTGIGIKPEDVPRLFRKFGQLEAGQIAAPGGTGLGLAICSKIIEQHKGHLWVESEYKQGSVFSFVIPLAT